MFRVLLSGASAAILLSCTGCGSNSPAATTTTTTIARHFELPKKMIAGYTSGANASIISNAVKDGVNVIFWSFMEFRNNSLRGGVSSEVVAPIHKALMEIGRGDVLHFVSFGGWDAPHGLNGTCGDERCSAESYAKAFKVFDKEIQANISGFPGFAGIDWDLEGNDNLDAPTNVFNQDTYEYVLNVSKGVQQDGYLVSMVPAQSYFDCGKSVFDTSLKHQAEQAPLGWTYHGHNAYVVLFAKCPECFDLVMVQYYEGYSYDGFLLYWNGSQENVGAEGWPKNGTAERQQQIIKDNIECLVEGWTVDFDGYMGLPNATKVTVPAEKVVVALGNGWVGPKPNSFKVPFFSGVSSGQAWCEASQQVRGFAYWDIHDDSTGAPHMQALVRDLSSTMASCNTSSAVLMTV